MVYYPFGFKNVSLEEYKKNSFIEFFPGDEKMFSFCETINYYQGNKFQYLTLYYYPIIYE